MADVRHQEGTVPPLSAVEAAEAEQPAADVSISTPGADVPKVETGQVSTEGNPPPPPPPSTPVGSGGDDGRPSWYSFPRLIAVVTLVLSGFGVWAYLSEPMTVDTVPPIVTYSEADAPVTPAPADQSVARSSVSSLPVSPGRGSVWDGAGELVEMRSGESDAPSPLVSDDFGCQRGVYRLSRVNGVLRVPDEVWCTYNEHLYRRISELREGRSFFIGGQEVGTEFCLGALGMERTYSPSTRLCHAFLRMAENGTVEYLPDGLPRLTSRDLQAVGLFR